MKSPLKIVKTYLKRDDDPIDIPEWRVKLAWGLRAMILASGLFQTFFGETTIGILILLSLFMITIPGFFTKQKITHIPLEIELLLFTMVIIQFIIGEANDFYTNVPYYDKFVHYMIPMFLGLIGFIVVYTMHKMGKIETSKGVMVLLIFFVTLGIGALWEIFEYLSDEILYPRIDGWHHFQGSLTEDALHDTMNDLILDSLGAIVGATLGLVFISKAEKKHSTRLGEIVEEIAEQLNFK